MVLLLLCISAAIWFISVSAHCTNPRIRKEWRSLSPVERASWIKAVVCLSKLPHNRKIVATGDPAITWIPPIDPNSSYYDDFSYVHMDLNPLIHNTAFFLPWHRQFVQTLEDELRSKCGYDGAQPYWNWTLDTEDFYHATIFSNSTFDGLGAWGDPNNDFQISTGGLKGIKLTYPVPHYIRRNYTNLVGQALLSFPKLPGAPPVDPSLMLNTTFTRQIFDSIVNSFTGDFINFQGTIEGFSGPHPGPHLILGGDMSGLCPYGLASPVCVPGPKWTPNDPLFFLHHAMIDKLWYDWQRQDSSNKNAFGGGSISFLASSNASIIQYPNGAPPWLNESSVIPGDGLWKNVRICDVMDTVGGKLCYIYA